MGKYRANRLNFLRERAGLSMARLGELCQPPATASQINKLEKGQTQLTGDWADRLALALDVRASELFEDAMEALSPDERDLLATYRGMGENERIQFRAIGPALSQSAQVTKKAG